MLTAGNIVTTATILYRSHVKSYLKISLVASLWSLLPFVILLPVIIFFTYLADNLSSETVLVFFLAFTPFWLILLLFCLAKAWMNSALISRLGFYELINQPETPTMARQQIAPRLLMFLLAGLLLALILFAVYIAFSTILVILFVAFAIVFAGFFGVAGLTASPGLTMVIGVFAVLLYILALVAFFAVLLWFYSRFFVLELPLAVESNTNAFQALGINWKLTNRNIRLVILIISIAGLVNFPLFAIIQTASLLLQPFVLSLTEPSSPFFVLISYLIGTIIGIMGNIVLLPFWQAVKAVTYYDLRCRKEGLGLTLREVSADSV
jgi:hypothetical protein